jgi:RNA polymerase sigma-70 factor (ECF subfamily)
VLREAFDYPYDEIAGMLQLGQANTRQVVSGAGKRLSADRRDPVDAAEHRRLLEAFVAAARHGDVAALRTCCPPTSSPTRTATACAARHGWTSWVPVNGRPVMMVVKDGTAVALMSVRVGPDGVDGLYWILAPEKLRAYERSDRGSSPVGRSPPTPSTFKL